MPKEGYAAKPIILRHTLCYFRRVWFCRGILHYAESLDYLCAVLEQEEFPRSYSVEFRGKEKIYLPIPGLPKKGVNQLFACAVQHPNLHPAKEIP